MANFSVPNLCGASAELNAASSKIADLELNITSQIDAAASEAAAAVNTALADVKAGLDGLALDLPSIPSINFQSELTSLVSDFNLTTPQGLAQYTSKLAELEKDFGDTLTKAGKSLDSLITDATAAVSGGGDLCAIAPNLELPAAGGDVVEKAQGVKTALKNAADEVESTVTVNASVETKKTALKAKVESVKTGEVFVKADPIKDVEPVVTKIGKTVKVTTPTKSTTTTTETITTTTGGGSTTTYAAPVAKRKTQSDNGLSTRYKQTREYFVLKGSINEEYWSSGGKRFNNEGKQKKHKVVDDISNIRLKYDYADIKYMRVKVEGKAVDLTATKLKDYYGRRKEDGYKRLDYSNARRGKSADKFNELDFVGGSILAADSKLVEIIDYDTGQPLSEGSTAYIVYYYYEKVDPNFSG